MGCPLSWLVYWGCRFHGGGENVVLAAAETAHGRLFPSVASRR